MFKNIVSRKYNFLVEVIDRGIGIGTQDQINLFQPFYRSTSQENRNMNVNGHGLGLSICKMISDQLGGTLDLKSGLGKGTTVSFGFSSECRDLIADQVESARTHLS